MLVADAYPGMEGRAAARSGFTLEGITRSPVNRLLEEQDLKVVEQNITPDEVVAGVREGSTGEVFPCRTVALVTPWGSLASDDFDVPIGAGEARAVTMGIGPGVRWLRGHRALRI